MSSQITSLPEEQMAESPLIANSGRKKMLFVTSMPAAKTNALGVQTLFLAEPFSPDWAHCYWWDWGLGKSEVPNSHRLNTSLPLLWPFVTGRGFVTRMVARCGIGWWQEFRLIESKKPKLRKLVGDAGFAHASAIKNADATQCREILEVLGCPFAVHVWDLLDDNLNEDFRWLFSKAKHVFCVSPTMYDEIHAMAPCDTSTLLFSRPPSRFRAKYRGANNLRIGLIGTFHAYTEGLELLLRAIQEMRGEFADIRLRYIGPPNELAFFPDELKPFTECAGFLDDDDRDRALADCDLAYIPGPSRPPQTDPRSRHSIPSRSADYAAVGLPMIAATDNQSATGLLFSPMRDRGFFPVSEPADFRLAVQKLRNQECWSRAASECRSFFDAHFNKQQAQDKLRSVAEPFLR